jgi:hypothetical protein
MLLHVLLTVGYLQLAESKLKALSVSVRLKQPDKRFEAIKNYGNELQVHMMRKQESRHIDQIKKVKHKSHFSLKFLTKKHYDGLLYLRYYPLSRLIDGSASGLVRIGGQVWWVCWNEGCMIGPIVQ